MTCHYEAGLPIHSISYVWNFLRRELEAEVADALKGMQLVAAGDGAVFDARRGAGTGATDGPALDARRGNVGRGTGALLDARRGPRGAAQAPVRHKAALEGLDGLAVDVEALPKLKERPSFGSPGGKGKGSPGGKGRKGGRGGGRGRGRGRGRGKSSW